MLDLDRDELKRVLPLASAYGLVLASLYVLKPARNALFLDGIGVAQLPYVLILVALVGGVAAGLYGRYATQLRTDKLIVRTYLVLMAMLVGFRFVIPIGGGWVFYAFYVWVALYGLLSTSLIWLLANAVFTPREARRFFGFIGTGGIAGAIAGGVVTGQITSVVGTENLLLVCIGILGVVLVLLRLTPSVEHPEKKRRREDPPGLEAITKSRLLSSLALTAALIAVIAVIVDIQFNEIVDRTFETKDEKAAFFGQFFAYLSGFGILFQLLLTPWILRSLGVGVAILILPVAMGLGSTAIILFPGLIAGILAKGADGGFRHSVHKAGSEVLFLPVPAEVKKRTKLFLDTTVDTSATGVGALLVLLLTGPLGVEYRMLSVVTVGLTVAVFIVGRRVRRAYVDAFREALESQKIDVSDLTVDLTEAGAISALLPSLQSTNEREVLYVLDILSSARSRLLPEPLAQLLQHDSPEVRRRALIALANQQGGSIAGFGERLLEDEDEGVRQEAMYFTCTMEANPEKFLARYLASEESGHLASALGCIARLPYPEVKRLLTVEQAERLAAHPDPNVRARAARAIATAKESALRPYLEALTRDPEPFVVTQAIEGIGEARDRSFVPWLLNTMTQKQHKRAARAALARFGGEIVGTLREALGSPEVTLGLERSIPRVLGEIGDQAALDLLLANLDAEDPIVRANVARGLSKLRISHPKLKFERHRIAEAVIAESRKYYDMAQILHVLGEEIRPAGSLLQRAVQEKKQRVVERIFVLLGLRHRPGDMESAYRGFMSGNPRIHASALELLDNVLRKELRDHVLPLLEQSDDAGVVRAGRTLFGKPIESREAALAHLLRCDDAWLRACALFAIAPAPPEGLEDLAIRARKDPDPIVRETAELVDGQTQDRVVGG